MGKPLKTVVSLDVKYILASDILFTCFFVELRNLVQNDLFVE
jgi:hypothetical protein